MAHWTDRVADAAKKHWSDNVKDGTTGAVRPDPSKGPSFRGTGGGYLAEAESLDWQMVTSTNVNGVAYNLDTHRLFVEFKGDKKRPPSMYVYFDVPQSVYQGFLSAPSKGQYVHRVIRNFGKDNLYGYEQLY